MYLPGYSYEFLGVDGKHHAFSGCSILGRAEFVDRLNELHRLVGEADQQTTLADLYEGNSRVRFLVDRCLELNGIQPAWVGAAHLESFLFFRQEGEDYKPAYLAEINQIQKRSEGGKGQTLAQLLAAVASHLNGNLQQALELAESRPANLLLDVLDARNEQAKTPDEKRDDKRRQWAKEQRDRARQKWGQSHGSRS